MTLLATADDPDSSWAEAQLDHFRTWALPLKARHPNILLLAANSAATLRLPGAHFDPVGHRHRDLWP